MKTSFRACLLALLTLAAGTAAAVSVSQNFLPETDFTHLKTYFWVKVEGQNVDPITDEQIKRAVDTQLQAKGWRKLDSSEADAYVAYQVAVVQTQELNYYSNYGYSWRWGGSTSAYTRTINRGTLTLDVYDRATKALVWRGSATDTLKSKSKPEKRQKRLDKAMAKLLGDFPPAPPK
jgi:hypothetical protein